MGFVLLGLTVAAWSAHACRIERPTPKTVHIVGECQESVLMSQLSIAVRDLEEQGDLERASSGSGDASKSKSSKKLALVNGHAKGSTSTFFHRAPTKK